MQVKFRQTTRNGCGSLSIANIFDDARFAVDLDKLPGERLADLNKKLADNGAEVFIDCLFMTHKVFKTGNRLQLQHDILFSYPKKGITRKMRENRVVPYLFTIPNAKGRNPHMIGAVHSLSDGLFHLMDSSKKEIIVVTFPELVSRFHITSVFLFRLWDHPEPANFVSMEKPDLPHIFQPKG